MWYTRQITQNNFLQVCFYNMNKIIKLYLVYLINKLNIMEIDHLESNELLLCKAHDSLNIYLLIISTICKSLFL